MAGQSGRWVRLLSEQPDRDPSFVLDANGFLDVERSRVHLDLLTPAEAAEGRAFVLLGGPGTGKTTTLRLLVTDRGGPPHSPGFPGTLWASAPSLTSEDAITSIVGQHLSALPDLSSALSDDDPMLPAGPLTVVVDQLDEHPDLDWFVQRLRTMLEGKDTRGLNVLIACRAAEYPESLTLILEQVFGSCTVAELAPLTWDQAVAIAAQEVPDSVNLLEAIKRSGGGSLASTPLTLWMLVSNQSSSEGDEWPALNIFNQKVRALLDLPHNPGSGFSESSLEERLVIASRIAAYLLLSGRRALRIGRNAWAHNEEITPGLLASGREHAGLGEFDVTLAKVHETLGTQMFAPGFESTEFVHSSVASFLAARYLVAQSQSAPLPISERQLSGVFLVSAPDEPSARIPEHLRETAAWIVGMAPRQSEWLASADPPALAGYSTWIPDPEIRSVLAGGLLNRAERIELSGGAEWPPARWDLTHPGLASQLSDILRPAAVATEYEWADLARVRVAVRLANDSRAAEVASALLDLTQSQGWPVSVRQRAARAANNSSPEVAIPRLRDLLRQLKVAHPVALADSDAEDFDGLSGDSELVGTLLSLLWPEYLTFDEAVSHIRPRRQKMAIGVYRGEAGRFAREVRDRDLDRLLTYATAAIREFSTESAESQLADTTDSHLVDTDQLMGIKSEDEWGLREFIAPILERVCDSSRAEELLPATARMIAPLMRASIRIPMPTRLELMSRDGAELPATTALRRILAHELVLHYTQGQQQFDRYAAYLIINEWCHDRAFAPGSARLPIGTERGDRRRLLDDSDTEWCLTQIDTFLAASDILLTQAYALFVSLIADLYNPHTFDLLENRPDSPEREYFRWVFDGMPIDDDYARAMREDAAAQSSWDQADSFASAQRESLVAAANRDSDAFWVLVRYLWVNPSTGRVEDARSLDVLSSPGMALWSSTEFAARFRAAAVSYLESAHDHRDTWVGTTKTDYRAEAGLIALAFLHRTEGTNGLHSLPPAIWASWTAAILCGSPGLASENTQLISELLGFVTQHALSSLGDTVDLWARTALMNATAPWSLGQIAPLLPREVHPRMVTLAIEVFGTLCSPTTADAASSSGAASSGDQDDRLHADGSGAGVPAVPRADIALRIWSVLLEPPLKLRDQTALQHVREVFTAEQPTTAGLMMEIATAAAVLLLTTDTEQQWPLVRAALTPSAEFARHLAYACTGHDVAAALTDKLSDSGILDCYLWLARVHPPETEVHTLGLSEVTPAREVHSLRRAVLSTATQRGTPMVVCGLRELLEDEPNSLELQSALVNARTVAQTKATVHLSTANIRDLLSDSRRRAVSSATQLAAVVTETLVEIEKDIHTHGFLLWDCERDRAADGKRIYRFRPKPEGSFGAYITHELKLRLAERSIVVNREVVVQPTGPKDAGQRPDILVDAVPPEPTLNTPTVTIPIEIKGSWHKDLLTAQHDQLLPYIRMTNSTAGIYLAAWFPLNQWTAIGDDPPRHKATVHTSATQLLKALQEQATRINHATGVHITPYVLTVSTTTPSAILDIYESAAQDEWK